MRFEEKHPPRLFETGWEPHRRMIADCGSMYLETDEQVTLMTSDGAEYDVTRKDFGFYATPSLNGRLSGFGLRAVLVCNRSGRYFVLLVENGKEDLFDTYLAEEAMAVVTWLDSDEALACLAGRMKGSDED